MPNNPESFNDETKKLEVRWNVWLLKEGKIREMAANMSSARQSIASALSALTALSTCVASTEVFMNLAKQLTGWVYLA